jgi:hypothetical protein
MEQRLQLSSSQRSPVIPPGTARAGQGVKAAEWLRNNRVKGDPRRFGIPAVVAICCQLLDLISH